MTLHILGRGMLGVCGIRRSPGIPELPKSCMNGPGTLTSTCKQTCAMIMRSDKNGERTVLGNDLRDIHQNSPKACEQLNSSSNFTQSFQEHLWKMS
ncbi:hypothetical protein GDO81_005808 [Engystomops pustulosus]|uniref:Uncharacterized protein n=1 Tax=Engystomops pustulosus TaxID=76066 RepID=A0AAV7CRY9_ENGPU|nr:hypothetical protein GDO81_005808 [Engystomops pustulosus]